MQRIVEAIKTVFPDFDESTFSKDLEMEQIPGWDSMNSVNLQAQLDTLFGVKSEELGLNDYSKVSDIVTFLKARKVSLKNL
jgi:acyl carrier protein